MIYNQYTDRLKNIISESRDKKRIEKSIQNITEGLIDQKEQKKKLINEQRLFTKQLHLNAKPLGNILNGDSLLNAKLGLHPDFASIKGSDEFVYHYIVSVFIDIQGSTNLYKRYDLDDIYRITNTIQSAAIHTCIAMGGHIQRLQGDGVFAYFGGKSIEKTKAVQLAVTACSMFTYFVKNDLKDVFLEDGIEDINTRIGIDFGDDEDVQWANFGLMEVSELTTNSLHTSLASKMQGYASKNGIVVGQNIKDLLKADQSFFSLVRNSKGEVEKRYIFEIPEMNFRYTQFTFDWYNYLKSIPNVYCDSDGKLFILSTEEIERKRQAKLREAASLIASGNAYTSRSGSLSADSTGVKNQAHRFHYGK